MKIVFLDVGTMGTDIDVGIFSALGDIDVFAATEPALIEKRIAPADVVITNKCKLTAEVLSCAVKLKLVCITATGYDNVNLAFAETHGIAVCNVKDYSTDSVALVTVSTVLSLASRLSQYDRFCKSGEYTASGVHNRLEPVFHELCGKTWGLYGYGSIGKRVACAAEALGCNILVCKRTPERSVECVGLSELFRRSDILSVHTPLNEGTLRSVDAGMLAYAKKNLILVNAARGAVVDEEAVTCAIEEGRIDAFGTDVYTEEPLSERSPFQRLRGFDNVIFTPHMAWGAYEARVRLIGEVYRNIQAFFAGERRNRVDSLQKK